MQVFTAGDVSRKKKLLQKQKTAKSAWKQVGNVKYLNRLSLRFLQLDSCSTITGVLCRTLDGEMKYGLISNDTGLAFFWWLVFLGLNDRIVVFSKRKQYWLIWRRKLESAIHRMRNND